MFEFGISSLKSGIDGKRDEIVLTIVPTGTARRSAIERMLCEIAENPEIIVRNGNGALNTREFLVTIRESRKRPPLFECVECHVLRSHDSVTRDLSCVNCGSTVVRCLPPKEVIA